MDTEQFEQQQKLLKDLIQSNRRLETLLAAQIMGPDMTLDFSYRGAPIKMYLPDCTHDYIQSSILYNKTFFEKSQLEKVMGYVKPNSVIFDIGANIGNHSVFFSKICGAKRIVSFEPQLYVFNILKRNAQINKLKNAEVYQTPIGIDGEKLNVSGFLHRNLGATSFEADNENGEFTSRSLDSFADDYDRVEFVKIDVEGMQLKVLQNGMNFIEKFRPTMWIELRKAHNEIEETEEFLKEHGYKRKMISGNDHLFIPD